jgi:hypothetical protein
MIQAEVCAHPLQLAILSPQLLKQAQQIRIHPSILLPFVKRGFVDPQFPVKTHDIFARFVMFKGLGDLALHEF